MTKHKIIISVLGSRSYGCKAAVSFQRQLAEEFECLVFLDFQRLRSEQVERSFVHVCETGRARRSWLRGLANVSKRYLITVATHKLGLVMRKLFGIGKPRTLWALTALAELTARNQLTGAGITRRRASPATEKHDGETSSTVHAGRQLK